MIVNVLVFALLRERLGTSSLSLELNDSATVGDLQSALASARPELEPLVRGLLIAVDSEYAADDFPLNPSLEIAAFPPVSGG